MADKSWIDTKQSSTAIDVRIWGRRGVDCCLAIERFLSRRLGKEISEFVETVGNASIGPFLIAIAGSDDGTMSALTETRSIGEAAVTMQETLLKIMDHAGESYFYNSATEEVEAYDSLNLDPTMRTLRFEGFDDFLNWVFEEARQQSEDSNFVF